MLVPVLVLVLKDSLRSRTNNKSLSLKVKSWSWSWWLESSTLSLQFFVNKSVRKVLQQGIHHRAYCRDFLLPFHGCYGYLLGTGVSSMDLGHSSSLYVRRLPTADQQCRFRSVRRTTDSCVATIPTPQLFSELFALQLRQRQLYGSFRTVVSFRGHIVRKWVTRSWRH